MLCQPGAFFNDFSISVPAAVSVSLKRSTKRRGVGPRAPATINAVSRGGHFAAWEQPQLLSEELRGLQIAAQIGE